MSPMPLWTEVAFAAIEDFTHGTAVVDGVMLGIGLEGQVKEPISWTLEGGKCVNIEGGERGGAAARRRSTASENATVDRRVRASATSEKAPFGTPSEKGRIGNRPPRARRQPQRLPGRAEPLRRSTSTASS